MSFDRRLLVVFALGFSSGLPLALLSSALQAWFASSGLSLMTVGMVSVMGIPYCLRFLWAPILDSTCLTRLGRRRSWMLLMQLILCVGFWSLTLFDPIEQSTEMLWIALLLASCSATQDAVVDAQRIEYLPVTQHGLGTSFAIFGSRLALLVGGGLSFVLAYTYGWVSTYRWMGCLMIVGVLATLLSDEPIFCEKAKEPEKFNLRMFLDPLQAFLQQKQLGLFLLFIVFYKLGEAFTSSNSGIVIPFLVQNLQFPLDVIGYINKVLGISAAIFGGFVCGLTLLRWPIHRALFWFGLLQALSVMLFIALAMVGRNIYLFALAVFCENFASGMCSVALVALFMRVVDRRYTATQFSILVAFSALPRIFSGPIVALCQPYLGWVGLYEVVFILSFGYLCFLKTTTTQTLISSEI